MKSFEDFLRIFGPWIVAAAVIAFLIFSAWVLSHVTPIG